VHCGDVSPLVLPNRPAAHDVHEPWPPTLYVPGRHIDAVALVDPAAQACPAVQLPLHAADGSPGTAPYRPAAQDVHDAAPASEYLPATQTAAMALVDSGAHMNPAEQLPLHAADDRPGSAPYRPAAHGVHEPWPPTLYVPGRHMNAAALVDPAAQACPAVQLPLHTADVRPGTAPNRPAAQGAHDAAPASEYVPLGHTTAMVLVDPEGQ
jgi:hypothetical protein